jgi:hypothetical protein
MSDTVGNSASGGGNDGNAAAPRLSQDGFSGLSANQMNSGGNNSSTNNTDTNLFER